MSYFTYPEHTDLYDINIGNTNFSILDTALYDLNSQKDSLIPDGINKLRRILIGSSELDNIIDTLTELKSYIDSQSSHVYDLLDTLVSSVNYNDFTDKSDRDLTTLLNDIDVSNNNAYTVYGNIIEDDNILSSNIIGTLSSLNTANKLSIYDSMSEVKNNLGQFTDQNNAASILESIDDNVNEIKYKYDKYTSDIDQDHNIIPQGYILINSRKADGFLKADVSRDSTRIKVLIRMNTETMYSDRDNIKKMTISHSQYLNGTANRLNGISIGYINLRPGSGIFDYESITSNPSKLPGEYTIAKIQWGYINDEPVCDITYYDYNTNSTSKILYLDSYDKTFYNKYISLDKDAHTDLYLLFDTPNVLPCIVDKISDDKYRIKINCNYKLPISLKGRLMYIDMNIDDIVNIYNDASYYISFFDNDYLDENTFRGHITNLNDTYPASLGTRNSLYFINQPITPSTTLLECQLASSSTSGSNVSCTKLLLEQLERIDDFIKNDIIGIEPLDDGQNTVVDSVMHSKESLDELQTKLDAYNSCNLNRLMLNEFIDKFSSSGTDRIILPQHNWTDIVFSSSAIPSFDTTNGKVTKLYLLQEGSDIKAPIFNGIDKYILYVEYSALDSNRVRVTTVVQNISILNKTFNQSNLKNCYIIDGCITLNDNKYHKSCFTSKCENNEDGYSLDQLAI